MDNKLEKLRELVNKAQRIVALTGAGCSTESGLPDFRGPDGLYNKMGTTDPLSTEMVSIVPSF